MKSRVLVIDDEETIRKLLKARLEREGYEVYVASSGDEAIHLFQAGPPTGVVITDLKMPGKDGFAVLSWIKQHYPQTCGIVITGHGEKDAAVKALRFGASDYLEKPFDLDELSHSVKRGMKEYELQLENHELVARLEARVQRVEGKAEDRYWYVSKANAMAKVNEWLTVLRREAMRGNAEDPSVLITGESGTGKEGIARMIHAGSRRARGPWVAVNCANFNEQLLESELFGHEKGAFTGATSLKRGLFEIAQGGTLFLDEMGEMDVKLQAKLLRVLQEKLFRRVGGTADIKTDVRVIAATNRDLENRTKEGSFREDLYHRLSGVVFELPPLRERTEDIVPMARDFFERSFRARGKNFTGFTPEAEAALQEYPWPGNIRELMNVTERVALLWSSQHLISPKDLGISLRPSGPPSLELVKTDGLQAGEAGNYTSLKKKWTESFEREYLIAALARNGGNVSAAAREAHLDRSNFLRLLRKYTLRAQSYRKAA
ncbi:MAG TPA: hypothetical protein DCS07_14585 [Bdellovibrionales bacterium]|nr:MAG: hypothetical protein A2X97_09150 [Bdellovibrionales bacterium GWA1_52_35]OFZ43278.1 MAG: hypothetical protein A2070_07495 [Bdellovibrionales bacterium GWC1_52_8]HAR43838.1 hypothetical protein [Bdellovibrionales bacterium]HCM41148.1 hypothetical protein [Bdellovibrionales bacterium]